ncbi:MAG: hypothetical protein M3442_07360 [Chloroflexota bacterium]|nr:hypothetical protein [Chloroflexota bacterium]
MAGNPAGEVERMEPWQLPAYLEALAQQDVGEVTWNRERITLAVARERAPTVPATATVVADGATLYVAVPDHSADDAPRVLPISLGPRRAP